MLERFEGEKGPPEELQAEPLGDHRSQWYVSEARTGRIEGGGSSLTQVPRPTTGDISTGTASVIGSFPVYGSDTTLSDLSMDQVQAILAMPQQTLWLPGSLASLPPEQKAKYLKAVAESVAPTSNKDADALTQTLTERGSRYGKFKEHAKITQQIKSLIFGHMGLHKLASLTPSQRESLEMICHKLGRIANGDPNYADSWVDIAGYAKLVSDELEGIVR